MLPTPPLSTNQSFDVVVLGGGAAGLSAALFAALEGASVLVVESTAYFGGTSAYSAGTTWAPNTAVGLAVNPNDSFETALRYLDNIVGDRAPRSMREAFLRAAPEAVSRITEGTSMAYQVRPLHPDYESDVEGAVLCGRAIEPVPFDGRLLGNHLALIRPPIPEFTVLGGMMVDRNDIAALLNVGKSIAATRHAARILVRHGVDRLRHPRGTRLVMGNALIGRLLHSLLARKVTLVTNTQTLALSPHSGGGFHVKVRGSQTNIDSTLHARRAVVLAGGGFNRHPTRRAERLGGVDPHWSPGAPGHTGALQDLALGLGAIMGPKHATDAYWAPVSIRKRVDGTHAAFPHFLMDRGKPGMVCVDQAGKRFVNEATSYHRFGLAMQAEPGRIPAYLITDAEGLRRYGLGMIRPGSKPGKALDASLADGYLTRGSSLTELASKLGLSSAGLEATVTTMNGFAQTGVDTEYGRGSTEYQRANGDASRGFKNPCLGPIEQAPFYALRLYPGDIGAATGLLTNENAQVLRADGDPIAGLFAVGNEMHSIFGGAYPGPGITLGPGLVFAYRATQQALRERSPREKKAAECKA